MIHTMQSQGQEEKRKGRDEVRDCLAKVVEQVGMESAYYLDQRRSFWLHGFLSIDTKIHILMTYRVICSKCGYSNEQAIDAVVCVQITELEQKLSLYDANESESLEKQL